MKKIIRFSGLIPALALSAMLTFGAGAQGVVDDVIDGAENIVTDTIDTADDILTDGGTTVGDSAADDDGIVNGTQDEDIPDQMEDDATDNPNGSKDESDVGNAQTGEDPNPGTGIGIPFMTAGLVAVSAAGVAYLTRKHREESGAE